VVDDQPNASTTGIISLRQAARAVFSGREDPAEVDFGIAKFMAAALWAIGGSIVLVLLIVAPPTQAIGRAGWIPAVLLVTLSFYLAARRARGHDPPGAGELFVGTCVAMLGIALLEWLGGGREAPYHHLYILPVVFVAAVQPRRRVLVTLLLLSLVLCAPLAYEGFTSRDGLDMGTQLVLLVAVGGATRLLFTLVRAQRAGLRSAREEADQLARRDGLTGLGNRLALEERLEGEIARVRRSGGRLSVVVGDLDGFKLLNDELGHAGGDDCLRRVAEAMLETARASDQCFRWGGDEFVLLLPDASASDAQLAAERLSAAVEGVCTTSHGDPVRMTCGAAELREGQVGVDLLHLADRELTVRKRQTGGGESRSGLTMAVDVSRL
jgi:diguanylate cyclase (GGDEF)-like protein